MLLHELHGPEQWDKINKTMRKAGYTELGSGVDSTVWGKDEGRVIKILMPESGDLTPAEKVFLAYYETAQKYSDNPHMMKFVPIGGQHYTKFDINGETFYQIAVEKLQPLPDGSFEEAVVWAMSECVANRLDWPAASQQLTNPKSKIWQYYEGDSEAVAKKIAGGKRTTLKYLYLTMQLMYHIGRKQGFGWDLHTENAMLRSDGTIVITDPWYSSMLDENFTQAVAEGQDQVNSLPSVNLAKQNIHRILVAAQRIYDEWDESNIDTYAGGGICHIIADAICDIMWDIGIECTTVSCSYEQHVYVAVKVEEGVYTIDIPYSIYETGGGFNWKKLPDIKFDSRDVVFNKVSSDPEEFDNYTALEEGVAEAFDKPYKGKWDHGDDGHDMLVRLPDGSNLSIMFNLDYGAWGDEEWTVEFWRNNSQEVTGEGDQQRIFATVLSAIQKFINKYHPERLRFSANKAVEPGQKSMSRTNLYNRLVQRYANSWGYNVDIDDFADTTVYNLYTMNEGVAERKIFEINAADELTVPEELVQRFTNAGWQIVGEGRDQIVLGKPNSRYVLKIVGQGSGSRIDQIRRYIDFYRQNQQNPHWPRVGGDRLLKWGDKTYYAYTQEKLKHLPGDEAVLDYLEYAMEKIGHGREPDFAKIPPGLSARDIDGLMYAVDALFAAGIGDQYQFDLSNVYNIMQRDNGQLVIVDPFAGWDDEELTENTDQAAVAALLKKHGWSMGKTSSGDPAFTWEGNTYTFYGERMRITLPDGKYISVVWGKPANWQGRPGESSFAQAVQNKYLTFDLSIWQALDRGQISDIQALQQFAAENERQAREALAQSYKA